MKKSVVIVWCVASAAVFFFVGMTYGKSMAPSATGNRASGNFAGNFGSSTRGMFRNATNGGFVVGQVISKDAQSITVQLPNGNSEIIYYSSSTMIIKPAPASVNDLTAGTNVMIGGTANSDGSLTAQSIQVREGNFPGGVRNGTTTAQ